jgi:predicted ATP-dependent serine protease
MTLTKIILHNLIKNEDFLRKVKPFIDPNYFEEEKEKNVYELISEHFSKHSSLPSEQSLFIDANNNQRISENSERLEETLGLIKELYTINPNVSDSWLLEHTEKWCQHQAIYNAIAESMEILSDAKVKRKNKKGKGAIPELLTNALAVSFDSSVGHDYVEQGEERFNLYHQPLSRISWGISDLDKITNGGIPNKTLSVLIGGVNVGKTLCLCSFAGHFSKSGLNVLYITLEISEQEVLKRIDANLLDVHIDEIVDLPENSYKSKVHKMKNNFLGKLIVKEYPTSTANADTFRHLLEELKIKKNFKPDIIIIDYLNICSSSRVKNAEGSSYYYIKMIAEELRGLAGSYNTRILTATQFNRSGFGDTDPDMTDTAESFGLPQTADFMLAIINNDQLETLNQYMMKQIKNRFGDSTKHKKFNVGVDRTRQRLYELNGNSSPNLGGATLPQIVLPNMQKTVNKEPSNNKNVVKSGKEKYADFKL